MQMAKWKAQGLFCINCCRFGHINDECPYPRETCLHCHTSGHLTMFHIMVSGATTRITSAACTVVRGSTLQLGPEQIPAGETIVLDMCNDAHQCKSRSLLMGCIEVDDVFLFSPSSAQPQKLEVQGTLSLSTEHRSRPQDSPEFGFTVSAFHNPNLQQDVLLSWPMLDKEGWASSEEFKYIHPPPPHSHVSIPIRRNYRNWPILDFTYPVRNPQHGTIQALYVPPHYNGADYDEPPPPAAPAPPAGSPSQDAPGPSAPKRARRADDTIPDTLHPSLLSRLIAGDSPDDDSAPIYLHKQLAYGQRALYFTVPQVCIDFAHHCLLLQQVPTALQVPNRPPPGPLLQHWSTTFDQKKTPAVLPSTPDTPVQDPPHMPWSLGTTIPFSPALDYYLSLPGTRAARQGPTLDVTPQLGYRIPTNHKPPRDLMYTEAAHVQGPASASCQALPQLQC